MAFSRASSSLTTSRHSPQWRYEVFLSFRGEDTREGFTGNLYADLDRKGIVTFIDDVGLKKGEKISEDLLRTIEESRIAVVVISKNYAESGWCLDELVKILECNKQFQEHEVRPVFYDVDPSEVRKVNGVVGEAFAKLKQKLKDRNMYDEGKEKKWIAALEEAGNISGYHYKNIGYEHEFRHKLTSEVSRILDRTIMHVADHPIGIESRISGVSSLLKTQSENDALMVGICGIGGIGKSTIARALYNSIASQFSGKCFIENVSANAVEQGLTHLQKMLLSEMIGDSDIKVTNVNLGISIIKSRLSHKKVLLILDDVDKLQQLKALAGGYDWFGPGSRIVVTARDDHLLKSHGVKEIYNVPYLRHDEALELFEAIIFRNRKQEEIDVDISERAITISQCHPLLVETIGYELAGRSAREYRCALDRYESHPGEKIPDVLQISYNSLPDYVKPIFLDVAFFFRGSSLDEVEKILNACGFDSTMGIRILLDRHFITCQESKLSMHDLLLEMGREIVCKESPKEPQKRSRLWFPDDIRPVLTEKHEELDKIEGIILDSDEGEFHWDGKALGKMKKLRILIVKNILFNRGPECFPQNMRLLHWKKYPSPTFQKFKFGNIIIIRLPQSAVTLEGPFKRYENLSCMDLSYCDNLTEIPDVSGIPNLEELHLDDCKRLKEIHESVGFLVKLSVLSARSCSELSNFPPRIRLPSLTLLDLSDCKSLKTFPQVIEVINGIRIVQIGGTSMFGLPSSFTKLVGVEILILRDLGELRSLPGDFHMFQNLRELDMKHCKGASQILSSLEMSRETQIKLRKSMVFPNLVSLNLGFCGLKDEVIPILVGLFPGLRSLYLTRNQFVSLPTCLSKFSHLKTLDLNFCFSLREILAMPPNLSHIYSADCFELSSRSVDLMLRQALFEIRSLSISVPGKIIPGWFDHRCQRDQISFWVRQHFPVCALLFVVRHEVLDDYLMFKYAFDDIFTISLTLWINGRGVCVQKEHVDENRTSIRLVDLEVFFKGKMEDLDAHLEPDKWNHVEISFSYTYNKGFELDVIGCGVHVYKRESKLKDSLVKFVTP